MNCPNCGASLGCSCKLRKASDGKQCCTLCVAKYEINKNRPKSESEAVQNIDFVTEQVTNPNGTTDPVIVGLEYNKKDYNNFEQ